MDIDEDKSNKTSIVIKYKKRPLRIFINSGDPYIIFEGKKLYLKKSNLKLAKYLLMKYYKIIKKRIPSRTEMKQKNKKIRGYVTRSRGGVEKKEKESEKTLKEQIARLERESLELKNKILNSEKMRDYNEKQIHEYNDKIGIMESLIRRQEKPEQKAIEAPKQLLLEGPGVKKINEKEYILKVKGKDFKINIDKLAENIEDGIDLIEQEKKRGDINEEEANRLKKDFEKLKIEIENKTQQLKKEEEQLQDDKKIITAKLQSETAKLQSETEKLQGDIEKIKTETTKKLGEETAKIKQEEIKKREEFIQKLNKEKKDITEQLQGEIEKIKQEEQRKKEDIIKVSKKEQEDMKKELNIEINERQKIEEKNKIIDNDLQKMKEELDSKTKEHEIMAANYTKKINIIQKKTNEQKQLDKKIEIQETKNDLKNEYINLENTMNDIKTQKNKITTNIEKKLEDFKNAGLKDRRMTMQNDALAKQFKTIQNSEDAKKIYAQIWNEYYKEGKDTKLRKNFLHTYPDINKYIEIWGEEENKLEEVNNNIKIYNEKKQKLLDELKQKENEEYHLNLELQKQREQPQIQQRNIKQTITKRTSPTKPLPPLETTSQLEPQLAIKPEIVQTTQPEEEKKEGKSRERKKSIIIFDKVLTSLEEELKFLKNKQFTDIIEKMKVNYWYGEPGNSPRVKGFESLQAPIKEIQLSEDKKKEIEELRKKIGPIIKEKVKIAMHPQNPEYGLSIAHPRTYSEVYGALQKGSDDLEGIKEINPEDKKIAENIIRIFTENIKEETQKQTEQEENKEEPKEGNSRYKNFLPDGIDDMKLSEMMDPFKDFAGVVASDELNKITEHVKDNDMNNFGFIYAISKRNTKGPTHWCSCYIDRDQGSCEIFDPQPIVGMSKIFKHNLQKMIEDIGVDHYLRLKENQNMFQAEDSNTCGLHSAIFLMKRFNGIPYFQATHPQSVDMNEKECKNIYSQYKKFGYI